MFPGTGLKNVVKVIPKSSMLTMLRVEEIKCLKRGIFRENIARNLVTTWLVVILWIKVQNSSHV